MELTITFCGDIMLGAEVGERMGNSTVAEWVKDVSGAWSGADLLIGNLECPCVVQARPIESDRPELVFHATASRLTELAAAGFSALTIANNHILNCGPQGLLETIQGLNDAGIYHAGAGMNIAQALQPAFIPVRGATVGLVAFCYGPGGAGPSRPGVALHDFNSMRDSLKSARAGSDLVIATLHAGLEYSDVPPSETRAYFRFLADNGADVVVGHHPHVLQGLEWIGGVPIAYSLGNFLFHSSLPHVAQRAFKRIAMGVYAPDEILRHPNKFIYGALLTVKFSDKSKSTSWHPFRQGADLRPRLCYGDAKIEDLNRLADLSAVLSNTNDSRHALADRVTRSSRQRSIARLGIREVMMLASKPKWKYVARGLDWLIVRMKSVKAQ